MGKVRVSANITLDRYIAAAECMCSKHGFKASAAQSPQELQQHLIKELKDPKTAELNDLTIIMEGKAPRFVFRENGEIMHISKDGRESFLFTGSDGAGFVQYESSANGLKPSFIFYSDPAGKIEREGEEASSISSEQIKGTVLSALAALELIDEFRRKAAMGILLTGMVLK